MVQLKINTQIKEYPDDITWQVIADEYQSGYSDEILLVQVNGKLQELQEKIREGEVQFITARQKPGISAYQRSATLLMLKAFYAVAGPENVEKVIVDFSIGKGFFVEARGSFTLNQELLDQVKAKMQEYVDQEIPILKRSISTDDAITLGAVEYKYKLMFEDRSISVLSYNLETLLAEKMQTILARGLANTRMRDFYDVYEIMNSKADQISFDVLKKAFAATCMKRETSFGEEEVRETLDKIKDDSGLEEMWNRFKRVNYFVDDLSWGEVSETIVDNIEEIAVS